MREADNKAVSEAVIAAAIAVHQALGPGLLESVYERALLFELRAAGISARSQVEVAVSYRNVSLGIGFRLDVLVANCVAVEIKSVSRFDPVHLKQLITYLRLSGLKTGLLLNFNALRLVDGVKRVSL